MININETTNLSPSNVITLVYHQIRLHSNYRRFSLTQILSNPMNSAIRSDDQNRTSTGHREICTLLIKSDNSGNGYAISLFE